jgi:hypothetical protein
MGVRLSTGVGPLRVSIPLTGGRRRRRGRGSSSGIADLFKLMFYLVVLGAWLAWAIVALLVAGVAKLRHKDGLVQSMIRSLKWNIPGLR